MSSTTRFAKIAALTAAITLPLTLAACGGGATADPGATTSSAPSASTSSSTSTEASESPSASASASVADQPFGAGCAAVPKSGKGSFDGMSQDPVATAASNNPALSTLVTAVKAAGLVDTLNTAEAITVFAPADSAFKAMDPATLKKALGDPKGLLTDVLTAHVVAGRLSPDELAGTHQSLNKDQKVTVTGSGESFKVNGQATVVCGNVQTANATVYIIDQVLLPKS
ncbi:MAG: fasciclin domain-containing protein [Propionibacteriaceae bacterium]|nr:fasciclin domain-containing protein [Propionibacteriaceae bacterium]